MHEKESLIELIRQIWPTRNKEEESAFEAFCADYLAEKENDYDSIGIGYMGQ